MLTGKRCLRVDSTRCLRLVRLWSSQSLGSFSTAALHKQAVATLTETPFCTHCALCAPSTLAFWLVLRMAAGLWSPTMGARMERRAATSVLAGEGSQYVDPCSRMPCIFSLVLQSFAPDFDASLPAPAVAVAQQSDCTDYSEWPNQNWQRQRHPPNCIVQGS